MIPLNRMPNLPVEMLVGHDLADIAINPLAPYSPEVIDFLSALSSRLFKNSICRNYPDIIGFAYWCRRANLIKLARNFNSKNRVGRGLALHIAPSNVPVNFAFSYAFGLLAGNSNIVRIAEVKHQQALIICSVMNELLKEPIYQRVAKMTGIITYPRDDLITEALSAISHSRILWGGDKTIAHLRSLKTTPRCLDICFSDRYSICILGADQILVASDKIFYGLVEGFFNDVFLLDQNACSSPHLVLWVGDNDKIELAKNRFWHALEELVLLRKKIEPIHVIDKYTHLCRTAILLDECTLNNKSVIYRLQRSNLPHNIESYRGRYGFFIETTDNNLDKFASIINERYQTVTYFGVSSEDIISRVIDSGLVGVDRVVPVGSALDIGVIWDGYDLIGMLSRVIAN